MRISQNVKPYVKIDGIYGSIEDTSKWRKFWATLGKFVAKGVTGKWEVKFTWKF